MIDDDRWDLVALHWFEERVSDDISYRVLGDDHFWSDSGDKRDIRSGEEEWRTKR